MKTIVLCLLSVVTISLFTACSDNDDSTEPNASQTVTMPSGVSSVQVTLENLNEPIETATSLDHWLSVNILPYTSGAPIVKLSTTNNPNTTDRRTKVNIFTYSQKRVDLEVIQKANSNVNAPIEDTYDIVTDQPAYVTVCDIIAH